jgi:hypothetical protein
MDTRKKPSKRVAVLATEAAICSLTGALVLLSSRGMHVLLKTLFLLLSMAIVVCAFVQWGVYFQEWVRFEIGSHEERTKTEQ